MKKILNNISKKLGYREAQFTPGSFQEALDKHEKHLNIASEAGDRAGEGKAYYNLGIAYKSHGDFAKAIECYEKSLNIYRQAGDWAREGDVYFNLGDAYDSHGDFPKAIECYEKSLNIYRQAEDRDGEGKAYLNLGNAYESHGDFPKAIECYEKSLNIAVEAGDRTKEGDVYCDLGIAYKSHGDIPNAIKCYEKSLNISRQAGDRAREGGVYINIGNAYNSQGNFPKGIECYEKSLNISRQAGDRGGEGKAYYNLGIAYNSHGDFPKAIECYKKSLNISRQAGDRAREGNVYFNLGIACESHGEFPKAVECYKKSLNLSREAGNRATEEKAFLKLEDVYKSRRDFPKAIGCYRESLNIYRHAGSKCGVSWPWALSDVSKGAEYREGHLKIVKEVGCVTEEAAEAGPYNIDVTPPEINLRGPRALEAYNKALTKGKTRVKRIPIMLIGQERSGKTSLKKSLQGLRFNPDEDSTAGIDIDPSDFKVTTEIWKAGKKDQAANKKEMASSFEHHVARIVVENLKEKQLTSELKNVNKLKDLESSLTVSTEVQIVSETKEIPQDCQGLSTAIIYDQVGSSAYSYSTTQSETEEVYADSLNSSGATHAGGSRVFQTTENYLAQTKSRDNTVSLEKIPEEIGTLIKKLRDERGKMESEEDIYSVLWDFAGESVYYETHQLFLTSKAIYLLVYDLSRDPEESAQPFKKQGVFQKIEETSCTKTNLDYLDHWMTSVSSQSSRTEDHDLYSASTSTVLPKMLPPVFLVCTHSDKPSGGIDPSELAIKVYGSLKTKSYGRQLFHTVFNVDNTKSGLQTECPEVKRLRESILAVAMELPQTKESIPIKWLKYEEALQVVLGEGHNWITIEHAKRIASEVCQIHDDQEFVTLLDFLHDQRILIHFSDTVELNKLVVLDPQWLIDVFKAVITVKRYDQQERGLNDSWLRLEREGILEEKLLKHAWCSLVKELHTFESLIAIMEKFSLLCCWSSSDEQCGKEYLVPSMLRWYPPQEISELITSARFPSLFVKFEPGQVPSNLFPRLVLQFLQWGRNEFWSTVNPQLYKNFARFYTAQDENCSVVFLCHSSLIEVVVHKGNVHSLKEDLQTNLGNSPGDHRDSFKVRCAREVFRQLVFLLECLRKEFCWLKRMKYKVGVICPVCCHKRLVSYCSTHHKQDCEREECLHFISESELRNANQRITCTRSAVAVNNKVYIKDFTAWFVSPSGETTTNAVGGRILCSRRESEDKSLALPGNNVDLLVPASCDPKEVLHLDQTDLEQPTPETTAKDSNQVDVVKFLTNITPAGTTGSILFPGKLDICDIPDEKTRDLTINLTESEDKSLALPGNVVESLVSPSCDPKEIVLKLKENLHLDQADLEKPSAETTRMIRCLAATAKDSNRIDVVKHLREIMPAGTTGPLLPGKLDICDIPFKNRRDLTIDLTVGGRWKDVADRLGLRGSEIQFLDERYPNPSEATLAFVAHFYGLNVDGLYDVLTECEMPVLADIL
ncbi:PREDICTED: uncharacterized protein LOC107353686 isoform X3 [Acropora digitifera]|uniref:uncharacterized protein LOC107353686 isoform X3 n=1 Tax=Acropora digitifera TaxID=70779 RepID=UPI00077A88F6|nr:PREDICTED: uncharacterized protein LOC107353686 isoform X3 [Acropora digitifera]